MAIKNLGVVVGDDGRGISSIAKTSTSGLIDTYTITYTDNTTSTFTVTNSANVDLSGYQTKIDSSHKLDADLVDDSSSTNKFVTASDKSTWNSKSNFSGSYNDLTNKPTIPSEVTESTVSGWGFTKNTGTYSKPSGGIPKTDLASAVQTSLGKADTALQSYTEQYTGTITGITMNGASKGTSGVVDLGTVITSHQDISGKENTSNKVTSISSSSTNTQYPSALAVYNLFNSIVNGDEVSY